jgi:hypothetical protein
MSGHTPGPWTQYPILSGSENDKGFRIVATDENSGCLVWIADSSPIIDNERGDASEKGKANARLIAAAPELLDALRALRLACMTVPEMDHTRFDSLGIQVNSAIAKAEGR